jgi:hypothetical protein
VFGIKQRPTEARFVPKKKIFCGASLKWIAGLASKKITFFNFG